jgi:hypothetical protein
MKITTLSQPHEDKHFFISPLTGNLCTSDKPIETKISSALLANSLSYCENPYLLEPICDSHFKKPTHININKLNKYNKIFMLLGNKRFLFSVLYSCINSPLFINTMEAYDNISFLDTHIENYDTLCLQRALLAAKTSKTFKKNGTLFIGATLPTWNMHAWIIEGNIQPDRNDRIWIMYRPLLAINF